MRSDRLELSGDEQALAVRLRALVPAPESVDSVVADIIAAVRSGGDEALSEYIRALDTQGADPLPLRVGDQELEAASAELDPLVRDGLNATIENVARVAELSLDEDRTARFGSHRVAVLSAPVDSAAGRGAHDDLAYAGDPSRDDAHHDRARVRGAPPGHVDRGAGDRGAAQPDHVAAEIDGRLLAVGACGRDRLDV